MPGSYDPYDFANRRHIGPSVAEIEEMLAVVGAESLRALIDDTVPAAIRQTSRIDFGKSLSERRVLDKVRATADKNRVLTSLIGQGYHGTTMPPAIQRNIFENPAWYTAYSPYQPEISQGRLEALLNFQTLVCDLTGLDIANASLLDEATAAAEAMAMAHRVATSKANAFFVDKDCLPQTIAVVKTRAEPLGWTVIVGDPLTDLKPDAVFGALFQYPGVCGACHDFSEPIDRRRRRGSTGAHSAEISRRNGCRHSHRIDAALRRSDGLRRSACCLYGDPRCPQAHIARSHRRCLRRHQRKSRLSPRAANA